jgi:hypothetical protein
VVQASTDDTPINKDDNLLPPSASPTTTPPKKTTEKTVDKTSNDKPVDKKEASENGTSAAPLEPASPSKKRVREDHDGAAEDQPAKKVDTGNAGKEKNEAVMAEVKTEAAAA